MPRQRRHHGTIPPERVKELYNWANDLETRLNVASENGLFMHQTKVSYSQILAPLTKTLTLSARGSLTHREYELARKDLDVAADLFFQMLQGLRLRTRLIYIYAVHVLAWLLLILGLIAWLSVVILPHLTTLAFLEIPLQIIFCGAFGGIIRGLWWLWYNVNRLEFRIVWSTWFLETPIMGALLGGVVYLAFLVGIVTTTLGTAISNSTLAYLLAIIAGYNWVWAQGVLKKIADSFSTSDKTTNKSTS